MIVSLLKFHPYPNRKEKMIARQTGKKKRIFKVVWFGDRAAARLVRAEDQMIIIINDGICLCG